MAEIRSRMERSKHYSAMEKVKTCKFCGDKIYFKEYIYGSKTRYKAKNLNRTDHECEGPIVKVIYERPNS